MFHVRSLGMLKYVSCENYHEHILGISCLPRVLKFGPLHPAPKHIQWPFTSNTSMSSFWYLGVTSFTSNTSNEFLLVFGGDVILAVGEILPRHKGAKLSVLVVSSYKIVQTVYNEVRYVQLLVAACTATMSPYTTVHRQMAQMAQIIGSRPRVTSAGSQDMQRVRGAGSERALRLVHLGYRV